MKAIDSEYRGFTLVELIVVMAIFSVVIAAVYSLYLVHMKTAFKQDEVVEVQQNLRIAMDSVSRDLKMAGILVSLTPATINPLANCSANSLTINTEAPDGRIARVVNGPYATPAAGTFGAITVDSVNGFNANDYVRILRPFDNSQPLNVQASVAASCLQVSGTPNTAGPSLTLAIKSGANFTAGTQINTGDVIAKAAPLVPPATTPPAFDTITYTLVAGAANNCPVGSCLARQVNPATIPPPAPATSEIVASNLTAPLSFSYIYDDNTESTTPTDASKIRAVRVTINGATTQTNQTVSTRQVTSVVMLRNRRIY
jgi:prepilin-type N-terminal cleavage/methylation domain-containing protein